VTTDTLTIGGTAYPAKRAPLWWHLKGLQQTASGYGGKLTTTRMVEYLGRWRRVYVMQWSNAGTAYVLVKGERVIVSD
jgi:hypothetical protein